MPETRAPNRGLAPPADVFSAHAAGQSVIFVDCRQEAEQAVSTLPGAVTEGRFKAALPKTGAGFLGFGSVAAADGDAVLAAADALKVPASAQLQWPAVQDEAAAEPAEAPSEQPEAAEGAPPSREGGAPAVAGGSSTAPPPAPPLVVCYCTIGARSGLTALRLAGQFPQLRVVNLAGSLMLWTHRGGRLVDPASGQGVKRLHTYGEKWALAPSEYEQSWF